MKDYLVNVERRIDYFQVITLKVNAMDEEEAKGIAKEMAGTEVTWQDYTTEYRIADEPTEVYSVGTPLYYCPGDGLSEKVTVRSVGKRIHSTQPQYSVDADSNTIINEVDDHMLTRKPWRAYGMDVERETLHACEADFTTWDQARKFLLDYWEDLGSREYTHAEKEAVINLTNGIGADAPVAAIIDKNVYCIYPLT